MVTTTGGGGGGTGTIFTVLQVLTSLPLTLAVVQTRLVVAGFFAAGFLAAVFFFVAASAAGAPTTGMACGAASSSAASASFDTEPNFTRYAMPIPQEPDCKARPVTDCGRFGFAGK